MHTNQAEGKPESNTVHDPSTGLLWAYPGERAELWADCITVRKEGVGARPVDYVRRLASGIVGQVHVILILMPSEVSRKLVKMINSRGFAELKVVKSEAALTQDMLNEALHKAGLPT